MKIKAKPALLHELSRPIIPLTDFRTRQSNAHCTHNDETKPI